jgi:hypothetical protein
MDNRGNFWGGCRLMFLMTLRKSALLGAVVALAIPASAAAQGRAATQTTVQVTNGNAPSSAPAISGDERFDRALAFQSDATDLVSGDSNGKTDVFVAMNANPDENASQPWTPSGIQLISKGRGGQPANGDSYGPDVDGKPGEPPVAPTCVAFVSNASNLVRGDTNRQPDVFVAKLSNGAITRASVGPNGEQANGPSFDVAVDGSCQRIAFSARASKLGGGGGRQVYVHYMSGPNRGDTVLASAKNNGKPMGGSAEHPSVIMRANAVQDKVAFAAGGAVYVHDFRTDKTTQVAAGGASDPVISEAGEVVAYQKGGAIFSNNNAVSDPSFGTASDPSIGAGGTYIAYSASGGGVYLYTSVRNLNLLESLDAADQPLTPSSDAEVSVRGNEVFFAHDGQIFSRYLGAR